MAEALTTAVWRRNVKEMQHVESYANWMSRTIAKVERIARKRTKTTAKVVKSRQLRLAEIREFLDTRENLREVEMDSNEDEAIDASIKVLLIHVEMMRRVGELANPEIKTESE
jgi:hypothetical protein